MSVVSSREPEISAQTRVQISTSSQTHPLNFEREPQVSVVNSQRPASWAPGALHIFLGLILSFPALVRENPW